MCGFNDIYKEQFKRPLRHFVRVMWRHDLTKNSGSLFFRSVFSGSVFSGSVFKKKKKKRVYQEVHFASQFPVQYSYVKYIWVHMGYLFIVQLSYVGSQVNFDILVNKSQVNPDIWVHLSPIELVYGLTIGQ